MLMKTNQRILKSKIQLFLILLLVSFSANVYSVDILGFTLGTGTNGAATSGEAINYPGMGRTLTAVGLSGTSYSTTNGLTGASWDNNGTDGFITNAFSTAGYLTTAVTGQIKGSSTGPVSLKAQYSLNGSTWVNVPNHQAYTDDNPNITVTASFASYKFRLPAECDNQSTVYVRWIQNGTVAIGGGTVTAAGTISMKSVVVQAELLASPTSQATQITIVSLTPTTITIGCTPGSGNRRYIAINTTNSFTEPTDDYLPTANATYGGSGEQIIYVGSGTVTTVTVPSSLNTYWFRYFEYNQLDNLTRFSTIDASASKNPKMCALPNIHTPTHSFGLIRATLGATIDQVSGDVSEIMDRGVFWDVTPGVTNNSNFVQEGTPSSGVYTVDTEVTRGTTIYYRGYAENESGVILSEESSFSNVPVFTGTGTWETAARWNVQEVPGANGDVTYGSVEDSPIINGTCTLGADNNVTNLTINSGKVLYVNPEVKMQIEGTLTNNAGNAGLLIKASNTDGVGNGSLVFATPGLNSNVPATVQMYSRASWNLNNPTGSKYKWQYFGIPVQSMTLNSLFNGAYVRQWDESVTNYTDIWVRRNNGTSLMLASGDNIVPGNGYELVQSATKSYYFTGNLVTSDFNKSLPYTASAYYAGQTVLSNPYVAGMDITMLTFGVNTQQAVYLYNTGTYNDWFDAGGGTIPGNGPGTYIVSTPGSVGLEGIPTHIPSMQGFVVKSTANSGSVSMEYNSLNFLANKDSQRAKKSVQKIGSMIDLIGTKFSDRMWILDDNNCTRGFDNGYDGPKALGFAEVSQLYAMEDNGIYQIDAVNDFNDTYLGFQPGIETSFKLVFKHQNIDLKYSQLYLIDLVANTTTDITQSGTEYSFTASSTDNVKRFKIVSSTTHLQQPAQSELINVFQADDKLAVINNVNSNGILNVYNPLGKLVFSKSIESNSKTLLNEVLQKGSYIVNFTSGDENLSKCIIIK